MWKKWIRQIKEKLPGDRIGIAISGGADSVALFHLLRLLSANDSLKLFLFHVDHSTREDSHLDTEWLKILAKTYDTPFFSEKLLPKNDSYKQGVEAFLRRERYSVLKRMAEKYEIPVIATGHHRDDQLETFFLRLLRGAGLAGLGGIKERRRLEAGTEKPILWRPLLGYSSSGLKNFLKEIGQNWRVDSTNRSLRFFRNRVRHELLPLLDKIWPGYRENVIRAMARISQAQDFINTRAEKHLGKSESLFPVIPDTPEVILREMLRLWWISNAEKMGERLTENLVSRFLDLLENKNCGRKVELGDFQIIRQTDGLKFLNPSQSNRKGGTRPVEKLRVLELEKPVIFENVQYVLTEKPSGKSDGLWVPINLAKTGLQIRFRKPGDFFRPAGGRGKKKLARWFIDKKIPSYQRDSIVLIACANEVIWLPGIARAQVTSLESAPGFVFLSKVGKI